MVECDLRDYLATGEDMDFSRTSSSAVEHATCKYTEYQLLSHQYNIGQMGGTNFENGFDNSLLCPDIAGNLSDEHNLSTADHVSLPHDSMQVPPNSSSDQDMANALSVEVENVEKHVDYLSEDEFYAMQTALSRDETAMKIHDWQNISLEDFASWFKSAEGLKKHFQKYELSLCINAISNALQSREIEYNLKWQKYRMVDFFSQIIRDGLSSADINTTSDPASKQPKSQKKRLHVQTLRKLCLGTITKLSKQCLAVLIAEHTWKQTLSDWQLSGPIPYKLDVLGVANDIEWFTQPGIGPDGNIRFHFTDACHILTCLRTKICTTGIDGLKRKAWEEAALSLDTNLNISVVIECVDKQDVSLARRTFAKDVEKSMEDKYPLEASFCSLIRNWFDSEDEPSLSAVNRCLHRLKLRDWLLQGYPIGKFPPPTQYVRGIPIVTYEAMILHTERKLQLHAFLHEGKYNVRATGSQEVEQFFSTFRDMDPSGKGTPKPDVIPEMMSAVAEIDNYRLNPERVFFMKTSRASVYPHMPFSKAQEDSIDDRNTSNFIRDENGAKNVRQIYPRDHFFDLPQRDIRKHKRKSGRVTKPEEPAHGEIGVRQYHARDDSKILAHHRKGLLDIPDIDHD